MDSRIRRFKGSNDLKNEYLEELVKEIGMGGEMKEAEGDYLMVVDANMAALKTDAVMEKIINYKVKERKGELFATVKIDYNHKGIKKDWKTKLTIMLKYFNFVWKIQE